VSKAASSAQPKLNKEDVRTCFVHIPSSLTEQKNIAQTLSDVDAVISTTEKLIAKKKNIKQGAMQQLLTGKKRLPGFAPAKPTYKQTELGMIPSDWEVKTVSDVADNFIGLTYSPENVRDYGTLVLRSSNIQNDKIVYEDNVFVDMVIPERALAHDGDILVCVRNGSKALIGKSAILDIGNARMAFGAFMTVLRAKRGIDNRYLLYAWQSNMIQDQVQESLGATINQITNADFKRFYLLTPSSIEEQTAIANVLSDMDTEISALETKLAKYRTLKTGMMQQLLTGKIRLV
jgi:type I restriction enzyme S subunit